MKYFTLEELTRSDTASIKHINNTPDESITEHLIELVEKLLDPIRERWAKYCDDNQLGNAGIRISSGFRNKELNKAVGGSLTSAHLTGYAADLQNVSGSREEFYQFLLNFLKDRNFDECFIEKSSTSQ
jgi:putative chitinase|nr:MAG TPA: peptidase [Caudoviricetes sp.]